MEWPKIAIMIITYKRFDLAARTIEGVAKNLVYSGPWHWHIADDGTNNGHIDKLANEIHSNRPTSERITYTDAQRKGVGASMNLGQQACYSFADYILWLEDDWLLQNKFDLHPLVQMLAERQDIGMVRLGYLQLGLKATTISAANHLWWLLHRDSLDKFIFAGHAALRHKRFYESYGAYKEGLSPGDTEIKYVERFHAVKGPEVVWPAWVGCWGPFAHIGQASLGDLKPGEDWQGENTRFTRTEGIGNSNV